MAKSKLNGDASKGNETFLLIDDGAACINSEQLTMKNHTTTYEVVIFAAEGLFARSATDASASDGVTVD